MRKAFMVLTTILFMLFCLGISSIAEEITLITYYPAPYGSYNTLYATTLGVGDNDGDGIYGDDGDAPNPDPVSGTPGDVWIAGRLGIGTTDIDNVECSIHLAGDNKDAHLYSYSSSGWGAKADIDFLRARSTPSSPASVMIGDGLGSYRCWGYDGSNFIYASQILTVVDGIPGSNSMPARLEFLVTPDGSSESVVRMVIKQDGRVGIGQANPSYPLEMASGAHVTAGGVWTDASSMDYKDNIAALPLDKALEAVCSLNPVTFNYKVAPDEKHVGFIAEEVPEIVATEDRKGLSPMDIAAILAKVVQYQQKKIEELKAILEAYNKSKIQSFDKLRVVPSLSKDKQQILEQQTKIQNGAHPG